MSRNPLELPPEEAWGAIRGDGGVEESNELGITDRAEAVSWWLEAYREAAIKGDRKEQRRLIRWQPMVERFADQIHTYLEVEDEG